MPNPVFYLCTLCSDESKDYCELCEGRREYCVWEQVYQIGDLVLIKATGQVQEIHNFWPFRRTGPYEILFKKTMSGGKPYKMHKWFTEDDLELVYVKP